MICKHEIKIFMLVGVYFEFAPMFWDCHPVLSLTAFYVLHDCCHKVTLSCLTLGSYSSHEIASATVLCMPLILTISGPNSSSCNFNRYIWSEVNSLTPKSVPAGTKLVLFGRYVLNIYVGIVGYFLRTTKLSAPKSTYRHNAQIGEHRTILTSTKKIRFWPSTHVIDWESFVKIARNSWRAEVIARSTSYQTLQTDKNSARNYSTTKLVKILTVMTVNSC